MAETSYPRIYLYKRIVEAKLFIDNNYSDSIDLDNISGEAGFSKFHFLRLFKQIYGYTPHKYRTLLRIEKAKELLSHSQTISEVCYSLGFESLSSFTRLFKRHVGVPPSDFAAKAKLLRTSIDAEPLDHIPSCFAENFGWKK